MEQSPHNPTDEFFEMFSHATRHELIGLREFLATEQVAAFNANDSVQAVVIEELSDRIESLLELIDQREARAAIRTAEISGVN